MPNKEMIISISAHEKRVAILENGVVMEFYVERIDTTKAVVGNIYKGKVVKVLPGMQSAFVDIGLERDAFLYVSDFFEEEGDEFETDLVVNTTTTEHKPTEQRGRQQNNPPQRSLVRNSTHRYSPPPVAEKEQELPVNLDKLDISSFIPPVTLTTNKVEDLNKEHSEVVELDSDEVEAVLAAAEEVQYEREAMENAVSDLQQVSSENAIGSPMISALLKANSENLFERVVDNDSPTQSSMTDETILEPINDEQITNADDSLNENKVEESLESVSANESIEDLSTFKRRRNKKKVEVEVSTLKKRSPKNRKKTTDNETTEPETFERIVDDMLSETGDMLKEAIVQQKIIEQTRQSEYEIVEASSSNESSFERVQDESAINSAEITNSPEENQFFAVSDSLSPFDEVKDTQASVQKRFGYAELAVRRSRRGRGRRGLGPSSRSTATDASETETMSTDNDTQLNIEEQNIELENGQTNVSEVIPKSNQAKEQIDGEMNQPSTPVTSTPPRDRDRPHREVHRAGREASKDFHPNIKPIKIADLLHEGQEILVQIAKEPIGLKGARITSYVALPGRYLVYIPTINHIGVSRKISSEQERFRLKKTISMLHERENISGGFIVRTACEGHSEAELCEDMMYLSRTWQDMKKRTENVRPGTVLYRELDLVQRLLRDCLSEDFSAIRVDSEGEYTNILEFINRFQPKLVDRIKLYTRKKPIFEEYNIKPEIDTAVQPRVWLKSGGFIVINQTEALVAIDVNTGKFVGRSDRLEDTITKTNLEAAVEIVRQIRLRDLGGIIVLDFIDMEERRNRQKVMQVLEQEIRQDRSPSKILQFNDFGLVVITRKRVRQSLERTLCEPCHYCSGAGMIKSTQTVCYEILTEAKKFACEMTSERSKEIILRVSPSIAKTLQTTERVILNEIEECLGCTISLQADPIVHQEQYSFAVL